ncbi:MAG: metal-sensing transcriptional repressor [Varibaculum sp.]|nr:metal-sensing transcriptional repressor [Varibaculum sp.]
MAVHDDNKANEDVTPEELFKAMGVWDSHENLDVRAIRNRLSRARGQLDAVIRSIDDNQNCMEIIPQLVAVSNAVKKANAAAILLGLESCFGRNSDYALECRSRLEKLLLSTR